jgi:hypothetical protein
MIRRAYIIATVTLGLLFSAAVTTPSYGRLMSSARDFQHYFQDLKHGAAPLNAVERFVFSLVLTNTKPATADEIELPPAERHT